MPHTHDNLQFAFQHRFGRGSDEQAFSLDVSLTLPATGVTAIFGESGSGKTSLLRCIAGLNRAERGLCQIDGACWQNEHTFVPAHKRALSYVFQSAGLLSHLSVAGNLRFAETRADAPMSEAEQDELFTLLNIKSLMGRMPRRLSGGESQRVAIARALLVKPKLLLMDEPLASLDRARKMEILPYFERLKNQLKMPVLYVSHSLDEVARLADHVVVLERGRVRDQGLTQAIFSRMALPESLQEQAGAVIRARIAKRDTQWHLCKLEFGAGVLWVRDEGDALGKEVRLRVLARDVSLSHSQPLDSSILNHLQVTIQSIEFGDDPAMAMVHLRCADDVLLARLTRRSIANLQLHEGQSVWAHIKSVALVR